MRILFAAVEMTPFIRVGGVADVIYHWAHTLSKRGHEVTVALPVVKPNAPPPPAWLDLQVLHIDGFSPEKPYAHEEDYQGLHVCRLYDLSQAIMGLCETRAASGRPYDVLHVNEWPVALLPFLLSRKKYRFPRPRTVLTMHSVLHRGIIPAWAFERFRVDPAGPPRIVDHQGLIRPLAAGFLCADIVTTPSPTYAQEMVDPAFKEILGQDIFTTLQSRKNEICGILHGLDRSVWNPANDPHIPYHYDANDFTGKWLCKSALEDQLDLAGTPGSPLVLSAGRLCAAKGTELLLEILPGLCRRGVRVVIAGTGETTYEQMVLTAASRAPHGFVRYVGWADTTLMHRLYAGADLVLMPSIHEACGLTQMEAQRYGAVPVVRRCGGLTDTVADHATHPATSTGFMFEAATISDFGAAVDRALALLPKPEFVHLRRRCMDAPPCWETAVDKYEYLYRKPIARMVGEYYAPFYANVNCRL